MTNQSLGVPERSIATWPAFLAAGAAEAGGSITATSSSSSRTGLRPKMENPAGLLPSLVCPAIANPCWSRLQGHHAHGVLRTRTVDAARPAPRPPVRPGGARRPEWWSAPPAREERTDSRLGVEPPAHRRPRLPPLPVSGRPWQPGHDGPATRFAARHARSAVFLWRRTAPWPRTRLQARPSWGDHLQTAPAAWRAVCASIDRAANGGRRAATRLRSG